MWEWRNPLPQGNSILDLAFGNHTFVAVGVGGTILTSSDGLIWSGQELPTSPIVFKVTYGAGLFVAVSEKGILTSSNGAVWVIRDCNSGLRDVTYGGGQFVAVGLAGSVMTSADGVTWVSQGSASTMLLSGVAYGGGKYVAAGFSTMAAPGVILASANGIDWQIVNNPPFAVWDVTYGGGRFVVVGQQRTIVSADVVNWTIAPVGDYLGGINYAEGLFWIAAFGQVWVSADGLSWSARSLGSTLPSEQGLTLYAIVFGDGRHVVAGAGGWMAVSTNGTAWSSLSSMPPMDLQDVAYGQGKFVITGRDGRLAVGTRSGPLSIIQLSQDTGFEGITYGGGKFVAVGSGGTVAISSNGLDWNMRRTRLGTSLKDVCFGEGQFVIVGDRGTVLTTPGEPDSVPHVELTPTTEPLTSVAFNAGTYVAVGSSSILVSSNASDWVSYPNAYGHASIASGNGLFMASGGSALWASSNGVTWWQALGGYFDGKVAFAGERFWALSDGSGILMQSSAGWREFNPTTSELYGVAYGDGVFMAVGEEGIILQTRDIRPQMSITGLTGSAYELRIKDGEPRQYELQTTANLAGGSWISLNIFGHSGWGQETVLTNSSRASEGFYRLLGR